MRQISFARSRIALLSTALAFVAVSTASAQSRVVLPAGTVIIVRTNTPLQSASARTGQVFESDVVESIFKLDQRYSHMMEKLLVWLVFSTLSSG